MHLFTKTDFISHAGLSLDFKINCDALTDEDWDTLAKEIVKKFKHFGDVYGIPSGGTILAEKLKSYATGNNDDPFLIVDDVLTTGTSFHEALNLLNISLERQVIGVAVFFRAPYISDWIYPIFQMW